MKKLPLMLCLLGLTVAAGVVVHVKADEMSTSTSDQKWYVIESKHTGPGCVAALDAMDKSHLLDKTYFGCMSGDHRGWTVLQAGSKDEAMAMIPESERPNSNVVQVTQFTPDQLKEIHSQMTK